MVVLTEIYRVRTPCRWNDTIPDVFGRTAAPNGRKRTACPLPERRIRFSFGNSGGASSVERAASRLGVSPTRYRAVVVFGKERLTDAEITQVHSITGIGVDVLRTWQERPPGDVRNPPAR